MQIRWTYGKNKMSSRSAVINGCICEPPFFLLIHFKVLLISDFWTLFISMFKSAEADQREERPPGLHRPRCSESIPARLMVTPTIIYLPFHLSSAFSHNPTAFFFLPNWIEAFITLMTHQTISLHCVCVCVLYIMCVLSVKGWGFVEIRGARRNRLRRGADQRRTPLWGNSAVPLQCILF